MKTKRGAAVLAVFLGALLLLPASKARASSSNTGALNVVCTALSDSALAYYGEDYAYESLSALDSDALYSSLHDLMTDTHTAYTTYNGIRYQLDETDADPTDSSKLVLFYCRASSGGSWDSGATWNREHVWPKSHGTFYQSGAGSDLHHIRPSWTAINTVRGNLPFGEVTGTYKTASASVGGKTCVGGTYNSQYFEPIDEVKGDIARILLYVYVAYEQPNLYRDVDTSLLPPLDRDDSVADGKKVIESLDVLLSWMTLDPVDEWEMSRNDVIESIQGNRNVFVDYPEYAFQLFDKDVPADYATPSRNETPLMYGDVDFDKVVTANDAALVLRHTVHLTTLTGRAFLAADVNKDNAANASDASYILRYVVKLVLSLPVEKN